MSVKFVDPDGNAMPAGVKVELYSPSAQQLPANVLGTDWTQAGGQCPNLTVSNATTYAAVFTGRQGPSGQQAFVGSSVSPTLATVSPFQSSTLTVPNYAGLHTQVWPKGSAWFGDTAQTSGGVAYALAYAASAVVQALDANNQLQLQAARVQSSAGQDIDSYAFDFLGQWLVRYFQESDLSFSGRVIAALAMNRNTLEAIQAMVQAFYAAIALQTGAAQSQNLAYDEYGSYDTGQGGFDISQGFTAQVPTVYVWDRQSRPDLADLYDINPNNNDGSFVIQIGSAPANANAWFLDRSHLDYESFLLETGIFDISLTAPDPRLAALVNFVKLGGTKPTYATVLLSD